MNLRPLRGTTSGAGVPPALRSRDGCTTTLCSRDGCTTTLCSRDGCTTIGKATTLRVLRVAAFAILGLFCGLGSALPAAERPNILWISCEDISPNLGCYGDKYANTPHLDQLARDGARFDRAFTHAGVCAVLRSGVITGMYPVSIGSQHMRSRIVPPPHVKCFTEYLRTAGYYCTNRSKTDYQFEPPLTAWDRQGNKHDDWRGRAEGQPFFSVVNLTISHESQIRHGEQRHAQILKKLKPDQIHDVDEAGKFLPPYLPNTEAARRNWAWYSDNISEMDRQAGEILKRLEADGLADNTLVVFWGDHGQGMPRGKRWIYDSGTHVPLIMRWPKHLKPSSVREDLVTLLDLPATMLAVAGVKVPEHFHGRVLIGDRQQPEPEYLFFHRDRMDEAYELMRGVRDRRFKYLRNFEPEKPYAQGIDYMDKMPAMQDWRRLNAAGKLKGPQKNWFQVPKPIEELYDVRNDPHEVNNLAGDPKYAKQLVAMRTAMEDWQVAIGDLGLVPEPVLMHRMRPTGKYEQAAKPTLTREAKGKKSSVKMQCETPGASIAYAINDGPWKLYTTAVPVPGGATVKAKACRIGFRDSPVGQIRAD